MSKSFSVKVTEQQRLVLLQALAQDSDYRANDLILAVWLDETGMTLSTDKLRTELSWLEQQGMITLEQLGNMQIATLSGRGLDIAQGKATSAGIARPRPE